MANTKSVKVMVPIAQLELIQSWVDESKYASVAAFCNEAISYYTNHKMELEIKYREGKRANCIDIERGTGRT